LIGRWSRRPLSVDDAGSVPFGQSPKISLRERGNGFGEMNAELYLLMVDIDASKSFLRYIQLDSADWFQKKSDGY
jgi:hypothetical protein